MARRYLNIVLLLSLAGTILSSILLFQHYYPEADLGLIKCGEGIINTCVALSSSPYSKIAGIPIASIGILFYLLITFMILVSDYAGDRYLLSVPALILALISMALILNIILGIIMIYTENICSLCIYTYLVNLAIFILLLFYFKNSANKDEVIKALKEFFPAQESDKKAVTALSLITIFFLSFSVLAGSNIIKVRSGQDPSFDARIAGMVNDFYKDKPEIIEFPASSMAIGPDSAPLKIYVFSDFLCSACYKFYLHEKFILSKYRNRVQIIYYHYPLDSKCNSYMDSSVYENSCLASQAITGAAANNFFEEYLYSHFSDYSSISRDYNKEKALAILESAVKQFRISGENEKNFKSIINAEKFDKEIYAHIELAEKHLIEATPTIFISGRKITGVPPREFLDRVVEIELSELEN